MVMSCPMGMSCLKLMSYFRVTFPEILNLNNFVGGDIPGDGLGGEVTDPTSMSDDSGGGASGVGAAGSPAGPTPGAGAVNGMCASEHGCSASGPPTALEQVEDGKWTVTQVKQCELSERMTQLQGLCTIYWYTTEPVFLYSFEKTF